MLKTVALLAAVFVCAMAVWLWRDPLALVQRNSRGNAGAPACPWARRRWPGIAGCTRCAKPTTPMRRRVVMIHGFTGSKENWYPLAARLRGRYRLVIPDLPGWGDSERIKGADYGFVAQSERVAAFIEQVAREARAARSCCWGIRWAAASSPWPRPIIRRTIARVGLFDAAGVRFKDNRFGEEVLAGRNPFAVTDEASLERYLDTVFHLDSAKPSIPWPASRALIAWRKQQAPSNKACWTGSAAATSVSCRAKPHRASTSRRCCCGAGRTR